MAGVHDRRRRQIFPEAQSSVRLLLSPLDQANHVPELVGRDSVHVAADRARGEADSVLPIGHVGKWHLSSLVACYNDTSPQERCNSVAGRNPVCGDAKGTASESLASKFACAYPDCVKAE
ncbi:hypothetical protein ACEPPN_003448 [Leptodophora sp. 'Broadleaf-Isolate-01']